MKKLVALFYAANLLVAQDSPERWWKGNLHTHTYWSDGDDFPEMVASWYRDNGYHFLGLTDHNVLSRGERWLLASQANERAGVDAVGKYLSKFGPHWVESRGKKADSSWALRLKSLEEVRTLVEERQRFLMLEAEEITGAAADGQAVHMNATILPQELPMEVGATLAETIVRNLQAVKRANPEALFHVNHPNYQWGIRAEALAAVKDLEFVEIWNGVDNDNDPGDATHPSSEAMWDLANVQRVAKGWKPLLGLATDDAHDHHGNKSRALKGRAWIQVKARFLSPAYLAKAMREGEFYASTGVELSEIEFDRKQRRLRVQASPRPGESLQIEFIGVRKGNGEAQVLAQEKGSLASYQFKGDELYVRARVTSNLVPAVPSREFGYQRAWTQPVGWEGK